MTIDYLFHALIICHIVTGTIGLVVFWIPVLGRKGSPLHRKAGRIFLWSMLATGSFAVGISLCTLSAPVATHPHLARHEDFGGAEMIAAIFGWMMLYLATLTVTLAWYGNLSVRHKRDREAYKTPTNFTLHGLLFVTSAICAVKGVLVDMPLMIGISAVGFATVGTNLWYLYRPSPGPMEWLFEHIKALVGTGISVYTAFFAFGAVRLLPEAALTPALWSAPLLVGLSIILYHRRSISALQNRRHRQSRRPVAS
ncbi:MAG: hypothetical protein AAGJ32_06100 [Pseudomonadota bacterium]